METLGLRRSFDRRYARPDDVREWLWQPRVAAEQPSGGMFSHLKPKGDQPVDLSGPEAKASWAVFARDVLPRATALQVFVPAHASFITLVTAEHADALPIFQWDNEMARNPVSWYVWHGGSAASQYGLRGNAYAEVIGLCAPPHQWLGARSAHFPGGVLVLIDGAKETRNSGAALFPETLKSDLHGVRSVIEAHSRSQQIIDHGDHAGGTALFISAKDGDVRLRVKLDGVTTIYRIDRLE